MLIAHGWLGEFYCGVKVIFHPFTMSATSCWLLHSRELLTPHYNHGYKFRLVFITYTWACLVLPMLKFSVFLRNCHFLILSTKIMINVFSCCLFSRIEFTSSYYTNWYKFRKKASMLIIIIINFSNSNGYKYKKYY